MDATHLETTHLILASIYPKASYYKASELKDLQ